LKFLPGCAVLRSGSVDFTDATAARKSPLAESLFGIDGVAGVFLGGDFVSVTKGDGKGWDTLKPQILGILMMHFQSGKPILAEVQADVAAAGEPEGEIAAKIRELIDTRVRPAVAQDGGDIIFEGFEDGIVYLHMQGACSGCPSSTATLRHGVENMLKYYVPEVVEVRAV